MEEEITKMINRFETKLLCILLITLLVFTFALNSHALSRVNIGFVLDGPSILNDRVLDSYEREITAVTEGEFEVKFQQNKAMIADWTVPSVKSSINKLLSDPGFDIVITLCRRLYITSQNTYYWIYYVK